MLRKLVLALIAPLLIVPLLIAAGGCAKPADETQVLTGEAAVAALRAAPDAAAEAGSGRFEMTVTVDTPGGVFDIVATGGFTGDQMTMEMDLGSVFAQAAAASGDTVPDGFDEPVQMVVDGTTMYMRIPMLEAVTGATGWISMTPEDLGLASGSFGFGAGTNDPSQLLETLRGVADDIEELGTDEVRGVATTHFKATVDSDKALDQIAPEQRDLLEAQLEGLDASHGGFPVEVWIGGDGLARRMAMDFGDLTDAMGTSGTATMSVDFFDYGEPVEVVVPDVSETTPFREVLGAFGGLG